MPAVHLARRFARVRQDCMLKSYRQRLFANPNGGPALVRRLLLEQAAAQWRRYALAFAMMAAIRHHANAVPLKKTLSRPQKRRRS